MIIVNKKAADLIPYANNTRTHSDKQIMQIASSIKEFGFTNPVLIDQDGGIIAGHGRVMAAVKLKMDEVPCIELSHLTKAQKKAYIIADNKLALNAGWDDDLLKLELESLKELDFDIDVIGFDADELNELFKSNLPTEVIEDEAPEPPETPISKRGDIWLLGRHRLMCGDSTSEDVDVLMDGKKADMVFTDPPYGMFLNADYSDMKGSKFKGSKGGNKYENVIGDGEDFKPELITKVLDRFDYCKELFMWGADYYAELIPNKNAGSWVVWDKRLDESADKMYGSTFELCWSKARHKRMIARVKLAGIFGMSQEDTQKRCHPTQKPVSLISWFFDYYSLKDKKIVVDVYGGSGSTLIASEQYNKECHMMELDEKYVDVIMQRYINFKESDEDVFLIREGTKYSYKEILEGALNE